ncbi:MAG: DUF3108 domain-containing protein [Nitrospinaceae bacterium]
MSILINGTKFFNPFVGFSGPAINFWRQTLLPRVRRACGGVLLPAWLALGGLLAAAGGAAAQPLLAGNSSSRGLYSDFKAQGDIRRFNGEKLVFDISFLFFDNAATADVRFFEKNGRFYSVLRAETKGFVGFFTSYRKHFYRASFDVIDGGRRVRTRNFEREVIIGDNVERTQHYLDYNSRKHWWFKYKNDDLIEQEQEPIEEGKFMDDILAAFYNFRNGVYGPIQEGRDYKIDTIPDQGMKAMSVHVFDEAEEQEYRRKNGRPGGEELLLKVVIPKEVFKTQTGELIFWSSRNYIPLETKVLNYILLGDLHVKFRERQVRPRSAFLK